MSDDTIKDALKMMPYGFYSFTTKNGDDVNAMVVNWVSQMSYAPRLIAVGIQKSCYSHGVVSAGGVFGLNIFLQADSDAIMPVTSGDAPRNRKRWTKPPIPPRRKQVCLYWQAPPLTSNAK